MKEVARCVPPKALVFGATQRWHTWCNQFFELKNGVTIFNVETLSCTDLQPSAQHCHSSIQRQFWKATRGFLHSFRLSRVHLRKMQEKDAVGEVSLTDFLTSDLTWDCTLESRRESFTQTLRPYGLECGTSARFARCCTPHHVSTRGYTHPADLPLRHLCACELVFDVLNQASRSSSHIVSWAVGRSPPGTVYLRALCCGIPASGSACPFAACPRLPVHPFTRVPRPWVTACEEAAAQARSSWHTAVGDCALCP